MKENKTREKSMTKDMTRGNLVRILVFFSVPLILSGVLQQLYSWADAFILGNMVGEKALAATGATNAVINLFVMGITGFASGISILSARYFGMGDHRIQKRILFSFSLVLGTICLFLSISSIVFIKEILTLLRTPGDIASMSASYLRIILCGIPFIAVFNVYSAVLRGIGDSKAPFYAVLVSSLANVLLDILFVGCLRFGVKGAATATIISQILMTLFIISYAVRKHEILHLFSGESLLSGDNLESDMKSGEALNGTGKRYPGKLKADSGILKEGASLSLPITIQSVVTSLGSLILQNFMNGFGTTTVAAITTAYRVDCIILLPIINLGTGIATVTSQNLGAGKYDRVRKCLRTGAVLTAAVSLALSFLVVFAGKYLIMIFGVSQEAVQIGGDFFKAIGRFYVVFGVTMAVRGYLEGNGRVLFSGIIAILGLGIRISLSYLLLPWFDNMVIAYAEVFAWCFQMIVYVFYAVFVQNRRMEAERIKG